MIGSLTEPIIGLRRRHSFRSAAGIEPLSHEPLQMCALAAHPFARER
jgi:hypothetical protein